MKTREIKMFVHRDQIERYESGDSRKIEAWMNMGNDKYLEAKLTFELPERKIEITESEFDEAFNDIRYLEKHEESLCPYTVRHLREKLFGKENG